MNKTKKILFAGETWITHFSNIKGRNDYSGAEYHENPGLIKLLEVFHNYGNDVTHIPNHKATTDFPLILEDLAKYDCVILSDIGSDTLLLHPDTVNLFNPQCVPNRIKLLDNYVLQGGGLLMIGGWMSFSGIEGKARYHMTDLEKTLPVKMLPYDDRIECCEGIRPQILKQTHPILRDLNDEWPLFLGYQRLLPKPNSEVLMTFDKDPMLVVSEYGKGRVAAFSSDCGPHWGTIEFLNWSNYGKFWNQLVQWISKGDKV